MSTGLVDGERAALSQGSASWGTAHVLRTCLADADYRFVHVAKRSAASWRANSPKVQQVAALMFVWLILRLCNACVRVRSVSCNACSEM